MGRCCSVIGCKSNYRSQHGSVSTFALPKNDVLRKKWLRRIPTDFSGIKNPYICIKHFEESSIIRSDKCTVRGEVIDVPRKIPKLREGSVPTIFPNTPKYLSTISQASRRLCDVEASRMEAALEQSLQDFKKHKEAKAIKSLDDVSKFFSSGRTSNLIKPEWVLTETAAHKVLCLIGASDTPCVLGAVKVMSDLQIDLFLGDKLVSKSRHPKNISLIQSVDDLNELINFIESSIHDNTPALDLNDILMMLQRHFPDADLRIMFIIEQIKHAATLKNLRRYSGNTLIFAASMFVHSSAVYHMLYNTNYLCIPHPRNIKKLISKFSLFDQDIKGSVEYLKTKKQFLKKDELLVNLQLDEIYISPQLNFKGGNLYGSSKTDPSKIAKTAQVFMISSILSKYKDVVSIVPVNNLTAEQLKSMILNVMKEVEDIGFQIISLISDNNAINRKAFELFQPNKILLPSVPHPIDNSRTLFFIFDPVHIIKCVRNNWICKKGDNCVIKFPNIDNFDVTLEAQFQHLRLVYQLEEKSLLKFGHMLSYKALYPSSIQKQNVSLALQIFNEKTIAGLKCVALKKPETFVDPEGTLHFLNIFCRWWKIINVHSAFEGKRFNDPHREPMRETSLDNINFLQNMLRWLKNWRVMIPVSASLSAQTCQSLITTLDSFLSLIPYMFSVYKIDYLLLGKFQNDDLEARFGCYRQMSGANYYISYVQVLESERKLRFKSSVILVCKGNNIPLKTLLPQASASINDIFVDLTIYNGIIDSEFSLENIPENLMPIITYIAGYNVRRELRSNKCNICVAWLQSLDKEVELENVPKELILELDRGKLILPTESPTVATALVWFSLQKILDSCPDIFISGQNQLYILNKISVSKLNDYFLFQNDLNECNCKKTLQIVLENICHRTCKILLSNLAKNKNDELTVQSCSGSSNRKVQKLNT